VAENSEGRRAASSVSGARTAVGERHEHGEEEEVEQGWGTNMGNVGAVDKVIATWGTSDRRERLGKRNSGRGRH
jgi:hypothetical protein